MHHLLVVHMLWRCRLDQKKSHVPPWQRMTKVSSDLFFMTPGHGSSQFQSVPFPVSSLTWKSRDGWMMLDTSGYGMLCLVLITSAQDFSGITTKNIFGILIVVWVQMMSTVITVSYVAKKKDAKYFSKGNLMISKLPLVTKIFNNYHWLTNSFFSTDQSRQSQVHL